MALHFTRTTPTISDLALHLPHIPEASASGNYQTEVRQDFFPAEWYPQSGVQLTWPHAATDWAPILDDVDRVYIHIAIEILAQNEHLLIVTPEPDRIRALINERIPTRFTPHIHYFTCPTNDTWARDHAFITILTSTGPHLLDYRFNGWGMKFPANLDNHICRAIAANTANTPQFPSPLPSRPLPFSPKCTFIDCQDFILEGGSIDTDGCGTILTTEACLLSPNRNPTLTRQDIEARLRHDLCAQRILWLSHGHLIGDDTDSHIDTLARFCSPTTIAYVAPPTDTNDPHHATLTYMQEELRALRTADGQPYNLVPLPLPDPVLDPDDGHRLPATYANFLIINNAVLMPTYSQPQNDQHAHTQLQRAFPRRAIIDIDARTLIRQHGSIHCSAMQYPIPTWTSHTSPSQLA